MNVLRSFLPGQGGQQAPGKPKGSVLSDWQTYQQQQHDVEAGTSTSGQLRQTVTGVGGQLSTLFRSGYTTVSDGISSVQAPTLDSMSSISSVPSGQQLINFVCLLGGGVLFLFLAFMMLPTIILMPAKFALCFTTGCCCVMAAFASLRGWRVQLSYMMERERLPFSIGYVASVVATLYASLILHSYILSLGCSALQVVALMYYLTSHFPGGTSTAKFMVGMAGNAGTGLLRGVGSLLR